MIIEVGVEVGVQVDVEVDVRATSISLLFLCTKAFPTIQVGVAPKIGKKLSKNS